MTSSAYKDTIQFASLAIIFILSLPAAGISGQNYWLVIPFAMLLFYAGWQQATIVFYVLLASLPFSIEYNFSPTLGTDIPDEALMLLTTLLFFAYWLYHPTCLGRDVWRHPVIVLLIIHFLWIGITTIVSTHPWLSLKLLLAKSWYAGAFVLTPLIIFRDKKSIRVAAMILGLSLFAIAVIALYRHAASEFSFATINKAVSPFFRNHVNYSSMLVCAIPFFFAVHQLSRDRRIRILIIIAILVLLIALFFSYARGAWLALGTGIVTYWLVRKKLLSATYIIVLLLSVGALFWLKTSDRYLRFAHDYKTTIFHKEFKEHLVATYQLKDVSTAERFYRWIAGVRMIKDNWLTGYGPNTFYYNYKPYGVPAYKTWVSDNKERSTVHNYFLLLITEQGVPGLVFFLLLLGMMLYYVQYLYHRVTDRFYKTTVVTAGAMLVMIITVNFLSDLIETDKIGSLFFLCLSVVVMTDINTRKERGLQV